MSATLQARSVTAAVGDRELFTGLDLIVAPGDVIGLVGPNGAGKTTLLQILAGERPPESGTVSVVPRHAHLGYLRQQPDIRPGETIRDQLARRTGVAAASQALEDTAHDLAAGLADADDTYSTALEDWLALGGADFDDRLDVVAADLGLTVDLDRRMASLSGGQTARVGLAALLLSRYDAYLLDEPTNDLDGAGLARLEDFVAGLDVPCVLVSHDREFLSRMVTSVVDIDRALQQVTVYGGSYDAYLEERSIARRRAQESYEQYAERKSELEARARRQRAWMSKGVKAAVRAKKSGAEKDKFIAHRHRANAEKQASKARQSDRMLERLDVVVEPRKEWQLQMTIAAAARSGDVVCTARSAVVRRGDFCLGPVDLQINRGDRIAITGPNGAGKTTLLGLLLGRITPDEGNVAPGSAVVIGEIDQARAVFDTPEELGRVFALQVPTWPTADVRTVLAKFGLLADHITRPCDTLSPGERTRAGLGLLQANGVNLLVLDEPTNHLDLAAIEQLEHAIDAFEGTVLLVTHDRRMVETVRLTRRWEVDAGQLEEIDPDQ
ncbi:ABC-F family ATP-binding cassette domain-containing protein [Austwickia sp. TVS 96-490-7B]|uniref:ABC-F family ATP-binding cassette domain-containing protein n=1 Tax=Austwickia sp. TVS 96-490-7B TaxID=2830843 RepID=UPI001C57C5DC|nr:ABC-F family ATP-binding cassette domain-containing protein [Austwickia sp. TVS 96-490-7B]